MQQFRVNNQIRIPRVSLIDEEGKQLGVVETYQAFQMARERGLDLVEVSPKTDPPICRIMDYGKFLYRKAKKERTQRTKQKTPGLKGVRIGFKTSQHDLAFKAKQTSAFLKKRNRVKIDIVLRGREKAMREMARKRLEHFLTLIEHPYKTEQSPKPTMRGFEVVIMPSS